MGIDKPKNGAPGTTDQSPRWEARRRADLGGISQRKTDQIPIATPWAKTTANRSVHPMR
ncbi:hypothetical protein DEU52_1141 [Ensifer adhaerens]|jgi:hypothetical protein|nr:hypothetical protein DEU52_1141 [Ensifer adhaerens]